MKDDAQFPTPTTPTRTVRPPELLIVQLSDNAAGCGHLRYKRELVAAVPTACTCWNPIQLDWFDSNNG